ncbi:hypothetical protein C4B63_28g122 [Trypanosoma cruzi]|uniref:Anaphase-promoting complex subunit 4-like WD40 domain-containing protein n=1 Tax=Trypanosoma cruzi TaxID=5693 RepID=A0A2V2VC00_TRYCR|nr:hypothetical protein C4B63_28g122 [Trypanosoma cruzi]
MLKVLHTKAAAEPILLATTCHNMNLFAIVTRSLVVVYRSTTLTVVTTLPLKMKKNETMVSACWSPSGRLLAIGLQCGELYLLDVESGDLIRRFVPRSDIAFAIKDADAKTLSGIIDTSAGNEINNNEDNDGIDGDKEDDPLRQPPILPISVDGAIVACTWASVAPSTSALHSHNELCLPLSTAVSSPIFEELEREDDIPVMLLLDQRGGISFLPGGMQEVCVVVVNLQCALDPCRMRVDAFLVAAAPPLSNVKKGESNRCSGNAVICGENTGSHSAYLVVREMTERHHREPPRRWCACIFLTPLHVWQIARQLLYALSSSTVAWVRFPTSLCENAGKVSFVQFGRIYFCLRTPFCSGMHLWKILHGPPRRSCLFILEDWTWMHL